MQKKQWSSHHPSTQSLGRKEHERKRYRQAGNGIRNVFHITTHLHPLDHALSFFNPPFAYVTFTSLSALLFGFPFALLFLLAASSAFFFRLATSSGEGTLSIFSASTLIGVVGWLPESSLSFSSWLSGPATMPSNPPRSLLPRGFAAIWSLPLPSPTTVDALALLPPHSSSHFQSFQRREPGSRASMIPSFASTSSMISLKRRVSTCSWRVLTSSTFIASSAGDMSEEMRTSTMLFRRTDCIAAQRSAISSFPNAISRSAIVRETSSSSAGSSTGAGGGGGGVDGFAFEGFRFAGAMGRRCVGPGVDDEGIVGMVETIERVRGGIWALIGIERIWARIRASFSGPKASIVSRKAWAAIAGSCGGRESAAAVADSSNFAVAIIVDV
ncbi:hypothetical protein DFH27DRAFT_580662 [Peziza echinospora]|nr:hypothetical protein DFH27DRAFT_580662 [Peziza echinospora]